jgi:hypothetical protein
MSKSVSVSDWVRGVSVVAVMVALCGNANAAVVAAELDAFAGTTLVTFEEVSAGTSLADQYASVGVADFNATVAGAPGFAQVHSAASFMLPGAMSGGQIGLMGASIQFAAGVDRVGVWLYKNNGQQYLTALDAAQNVLFSVGSNTGSADSDHFDFVGIASDTRNIRYAVISNKDLALTSSWSVGGATSIYDNLMFTPVVAVPEPGTWLSLSLGLAAMGLFRAVAATRRRRE